MKCKMIANDKKGAEFIFEKLKFGSTFVFVDLTCMQVQDLVLLKTDTDQAVFLRDGTVRDVEPGRMVVPVEPVTTLVGFRRV